MNQTHTRTKCYIQGYHNEDGKISVELAEKVTGRKVGLGIATSESDHEHFLRFLSAASRSRSYYPDVFNKDGDRDCIVISGDLDFDSPHEIRFTHNDELSYQLP